MLKGIKKTTKRPQLKFKLERLGNFHADDEAKCEAEAEAGGQSAKT